MQSWRSGTRSHRQDCRVGSEVGMYVTNTCVTQPIIIHSLSNTCVLCFNCEAVSWHMDPHINQSLSGCNMASGRSLESRTNRSENQRVRSLTRLPYLLSNSTKGTMLRRAKICSLSLSTRTSSTDLVCGNLLELPKQRKSWTGGKNCFCSISSMGLTWTSSSWKWAFFIYMVSLPNFKTFIFPFKNKLKGRCVYYLSTLEERKFQDLWISIAAKSLSETQILTMQNSRCTMWTNWIFWSAQYKYVQDQHHKLLVEGAQSYKAMFWDGMSTERLEACFLMLKEKHQIQRLESSSSNQVWWLNPSMQLISSLVWYFRMSHILQVPKQI